MHLSAAKYMCSRISRRRLITRDTLEWTLELFYAWGDARIGRGVGWGEGALESPLSCASSRPRSPCALGSELHPEFLSGCAVGQEWQGPTA